MKAAIYTPGSIPKYGDFADPTFQNENQLLIKMKAAAVKNRDKGIVSGYHYSSSDEKQLKVAGMDCAGELAVWLGCWGNDRRKGSYRQKENDKNTRRA